MSAIESNTAAFASKKQVLFVNDDELRPSGHFPKGYRVLRPYEDTAFGDVVLKKTRNGHRAKSGVKIEHDISPNRPVRQHCIRMTCDNDLSCKPL